ncbi:hypothetical protein D0Y65_015398 [Glycine soja]|uniref:Uncharacterized protein n=1 Tax=Glycine soja TaxID=3848 RepID=A0A445KCX5_GLYSO|nr:hypothetical protein D0Y65_015398 [Glycine soja]
MVGYPFTWSSSKGIVNGVEERLDRAMVTSVWFEYYPNVELRNSISSILDRSLIILATQEALNHYHMRRRFILKNAWLLEEDVEEMVKDDSFFFFRADEREVVVRRFLDDYVATSGKYINLQKSEVTISRNVDQEVESLNQVEKLENAQFHEDLMLFSLDSGRATLTKVVNISGSNIMTRTTTMNLTTGFLALLSPLSYPNFLRGPLFGGMQPSLDRLEVLNPHR